MGDQFLGEIRLFGFDRAPEGWALCNGAIVSIQQNSALFSLLGTTYGGDGVSTFGLPDLRGRAPVHPGANQVSAGAWGGEERHVLTINEMPKHIHTAYGSNKPADSATAAGNTWAVPSNKMAAYNSSSDTQMSQSALTTSGGNQAHNNMQPYGVVNYCISLTGVYPSRN